MAIPKINDLDNKQWKDYGDILTDSLWLINRRDNTGSHAPDYWGNYIPQIPHQMMRRYTRKGDWVLDPFLGSGTTLIEAQRMGRHGLGVELQPRVAELAKERIQAEKNPHSVKAEIAVGDSSSFNFKKHLGKLGVKSVQLAMLHPPYFDIIQFSEDQRCLSNASDIDSFLESMRKVVAGCNSVLDPGRFLCLVIGDKYAKGEWIPLGFLTMQVVQEAGFTLKSIVVKNFEETAGKKGAQQLWRYRALVGGFYVFKHEYVFVFQKNRR
ncbi:MAG: site-specific DNA-methyltransferase [Candidatus Eremiobacteraeota bacterium]|nr:site-specific DNA-methyltransferase [Candidatus Eremiobacteraeota bacterium]